MSRSRSLLSDTVVLAFGTLGGRVVGILLLPLYTYCLTRTEFGTVELITTSVDLVLPLLFLSVSEAVLRFAMLREESAGDVLRTALTFVAGGSVATVACAAVAALWWSPAHVSLVAAIIIVQAVTVVLGAWGRATGRVRVYALSGVAQALAIGCANVVLLLGMDLGVAGFLTSLLIGFGAGALVLLVGMPCASAFRAAAFDRSLLRRMLLFSAPLVPNVILWWVTNISGRYFLAATHGVAAVGLFGVAARFPALLFMVTTVFSQAWQLAANRSADQDDEDRARFYSDVFRFYAAVLILAVAAIIVVLKPLMHLAASPAYYDAWEAVPLLLGGAMFAAFSAFYGAIYTAAKQSKGVFKTTLAAGGAALVLNTALVPRFGVNGAALAIALCFLGLWLIRVADTQRIIRTSVSAPLLVPALLLLAGQVSLQYSALPNVALYPLLVVAWVGLVVLFRAEVAEASRRALEFARGRGRTPAV